MPGRHQARHDELPHRAQTNEPQIHVSVALVWADAVLEFCFAAATDFLTRQNLLWLRSSHPAKLLAMAFNARVPRVRRRLLGEGPNDSLSLGEHRVLAGGPRWEYSGRWPIR